MKKLLALLAVLVAVIVVASAGSTPVNWKTNVNASCSRLVVNANWTVNHPYAGRLAKLHRTAKACKLAMAEMP